MFEFARSEEGQFPRTPFAAKVASSRLFIIIFVFLFLQGAFIQPAASGISSPRKILTGWIPYYSTSSSLTSAVLNGDLVKEVMPFWYTLKGESKITDLYTPANPSFPMSMAITIMRDSGFQIIPTITDGTAKLVLAKILANPGTRTKTVETILNLVLANNFDGIDLDFEGFAFVDGTSSWPATQVNWNAFIKELSAAFHAANKVVSITTPVLFDPTSGKKGYFVYDWATIAPFIDRLRIMTYDYSTSTPGPIGPLNWIEESLRYAVSVVPASKIFVGVAGYGRDWVTKVVGVCPSSVANAISPGARAATFIMKDAANLAATYSAKTTFHTTFAEVTFSYQKIYSGQTSAGLNTSCTATRVAWYQDNRSYLARAKLVAKYRLGGITAWTLGMEDPTATDSVRTVAQSIAPDAVSGEIVLDRGTAAYGEEVIVAGHFSLPDKQPIPSLTVHLQIRGNGESEWREIMEATTDSEGAVLVPLILAKTSTLRMTTDATWERLGSQTPEIMVLISRSASVLAPTSAEVGQIFSVSGIVQPIEAGILVSLEKQVAGIWQQVGATFTTDSDGAYSFSQSENTRGLARYRVKVVGDDKIQGSVSTAFSIVNY